MRAGPGRHFCTLPGSLAHERCKTLAERGSGGICEEGQGRRPEEAPCLPTLCSLQTDKEQLTTETKELRQKVKHLQDQLSPLTRQREYQGREIQRLNKVGTWVPWTGEGFPCCCPRSLWACARSASCRGAPPARARAGHPCSSIPCSAQPSLGLSGSPRSEHQQLFSLSPSLQYSALIYQGVDCGLTGTWHEHMFRKCLLEAGGLGQVLSPMCRGPATWDPGWALGAAETL